MKRPPNRFLPLLFVLGLVSGAGAEVAPPTELASYLARPDAGTGWRLEKKETMGNCEVTQLKVTSQVWQGIPWEHDLVIYFPKGASTKTVVLLNEGGKASPKKAIIGSLIAAKVKAPVAFLMGIPNQPLFDGKREDDLIAETFVRYLETKDGTWPLLFPMVKSLIKGMDAIQELSGKDWSGKTENFIVGGASKRGWTTWLTAASDPRVLAITPMVIDTLNMREQLPHQVESFGGPSEQIEPYVKRGLVPLQNTVDARRLWSMVDPWVYRRNFTMPKLVVLGNNDRYWSTDALNLYWDDLPGEKYISYTPNAGHDLQETSPDGTKALPMRALNNIGAFVRHILTGQAMPKLTWKHDSAPDGQLRLTVTAEPMPKEARLWVASAKTADFRDSRWEARPLEVRAGQNIVATLPSPADGQVAYYADLGYEIEDLPQWLCTQLRIAASKN